MSYIPQDNCDAVLVSAECYPHLPMKNLIQNNNSQGPLMFGSFGFTTVRVFHKFSAIQECQYRKLHFSCAIKNEQDQ